MKSGRFVGICFFLLACFVFSNTVEAAPKADVQKSEQIEEDSINSIEEEENSIEQKAHSKKANIKKLKRKRVAKDSTKEEENSGGSEKVIEVNSVNFIKLKSKPQEIFIPKPEVADVDMLSDSSLYLMGLAPGVTSFVVHGKNGKIIADYQIKVTYPIKAMKEAIEKMHPDTSVEIVSIDDSIILQGKVPSPEVASDVQDIMERFVDPAKIINKLSIETATQVMLKVKIAEVSRNLTKSLGINWRALSNSRNANGMTYGFVAGDPQSFPNFNNVSSSSITSGALEKAVMGGRWFMHTGGSNGLSALIEALATESFASVLAEPTLIALSGKKAIFKSGGEQGYEVRQTGNDANTTEFKSWGTSIEFTPIVISEDRININVKPVVSTVSFENSRSTPSLLTKEAETTVELGSGQSLAIAGLIQTNIGTSSSETPFLADLPLLGMLFRNSDVRTSEKELIIIITPYIVKPSSKRLKTPVDMVPRMYSPLESIGNRRFHKNIKPNEKRHVAGFSIK